MRRAIAGSAAVQGYNAALGIFILPYYLYLLGGEAFGLIGVFLLVQTLVQLLDLGITPTCSRQVSLYAAGKRTERQVWSNIRPIELAFASVSVTLCALTFALRESLTTVWLNPNSIPVSLVGDCLFLMVVASTLRWQTGIYRGAMYGMEQHGRFNFLTAAITTLRFIAVIPVIRVSDNPMLAFFLFQVLISAGEFLLFAGLIYRGLPGIFRHLPVDNRELAATLRLARSTGMLTVIWILSTTVDRVVLSRLLSLEQFGHVSLAIAAAGAIFMALPVLNQVAQPRFTILAAQGKRDQTEELYRLLTQLLSAIFGSAAVVCMLHADLLLNTWTGNPAVAEAVAPVFSWYALANALAVISMPAFLLQFALGDMGLYVRGNLGYLCIAGPLTVVAAISHGALGVALANAVFRAAFMLLWLPLVHRRFIPEIAGKWLTRDVLGVCTASGLCIYLCSPLVGLAVSPYIQVLLLVLICGAGVLAGLVTGEQTRSLMKPR